MSRQSFSSRAARPLSITLASFTLLAAASAFATAAPRNADPAVWIEQQVNANDGLAGDTFGWPVVVSGTTAFVGADNATVDGNTEQGAVYVFTKTDGKWTQTQKLTASDGAANDVFGYSIALDGDTAIIGASNATVGGNSGEGAAYVFTRSDGVWTQATKLTAADGAANAQFGIAVALEGSTAFVGAHHATVGGNNAQGAVYVFGGSGSDWSQSQKLTASDGAPFDFFGWTIALDGDAALIGAPDADIAGTEDQGAVYVFAQANGTWSQAQKFVANDGGPDDNFGYAVATSGTTAIVGADFATVGGQPQEGAAYVFTNGGTSWTQAQKLTASDGGAFGNFGAAVSISGPIAFIGAAGEDAAYEFTSANGNWSQTREFTSGSPSYDGFGYHVSWDGATALIGASFATVGGNEGQGTAYFYGAADLAFAISAPGTVGQGQNYVSQTIATNNASAASPAVTATIGVPAAASFVSASATQGTCSENSGVVSCDFGAIDGNAGTATANVTLKATGDVGDTIENTAHVAAAIPPLGASAATEITGSESCPNGYTSYSGTLAPGANVRIPPYGAPSGEEDAILYAHDGFGLYARVDATLWGRYQRRFPETEVHRHGPAGEYSWLIRANDSGGDYLFCLMHP